MYLWAGKCYFLLKKSAVSIFRRLPKIFNYFKKLFLCFTNCPPSTPVNSFTKVQAHSLPTRLCARKDVPSSASRIVFCKRGLFKKIRATSLLLFVELFYHNFFLSFINFRSLRGPSEDRCCFQDAWIFGDWMPRIAHRRWVWMFASEMTEKRVTSDLLGGSSPRWCIAAIYGRLLTEPRSWDLNT